MGEQLPIKPARFEYYLKKWPIETDAGAIALLNQNIVFVKENLIMCSVWIQSKATMYSSADVRNTLYLKTSNFVREFKLKAPDELKSVTFSAWDFWSNTEAIDLISEARFFLFIQLLVIFFICIIVFKKKVILALCCFICIVCVVFTTVGITVVDGWKFDHLTYLNYMLMFCFSSNYSLVVGMYFAHCPFPNRNERTKYAITKSSTTLMWCFF